MSRRDKPKQDLRSAALLLGLDPDKLNEGDRLRCQLVGTLRGAIDHEQAKADAGSGADLSKLVTAVEALIKFLPASVTAPPPERKFSGDAADRLAEMVRGAILATDPNGQPVPLETELDRLRRENEQLRAMLGAPLQTGQVKLLTGPTSEPMSDVPSEAFDETHAENSAPPASEPQAGNPAPPKPVPPPEPRPLDLRAQGAEQKGGSAGFEIRGSSRIIDDGGGFYWSGATGRRAW
jgi:hypothetical protein